MAKLQQIIDRANDLARKFYECNGYVVNKDYRFDSSTHPREQAIWRMAGIAFDHCESIDIDDILSMMDDNEDTDENLEKGNK